MTHALRQNCGSFLYDSISREWLSEEERQAFDRGDLKSHTSETTGATMGDIEESVSGLPKEWPLFDSPVLSSVRVTGFVEKNGITVSCPELMGWNISLHLEIINNVLFSIVCYKPFTSSCLKLVHTSFYTGLN